MKTEEKLNMTMLCDFYELTMGNGYFQTGFKDRITYFDVYFRSVPDGGGFAIAAGLEQLIEYIEDLHFDEQDIAYLRGKGIFCEEFLEYLRTFRFTGDIYAVPEGTPVFPKEPMVVVRAPAIEAQLLETFALLTVNHQSLIATKANRIVRAAKGRAVMEFGSRRAQGVDAAVDGARAAFGGGGDMANVPTTKMEREKFEGEGIGVVTLIKELGLVPNTSEGFRTIEQGGLTVAGNKVTDRKLNITADMFDADGKLLIQKGKKKFHMVELG